MLLSCTRRFAGRLAPLSLFESAGSVIEKSLDALIAWLSDRLVALRGRKKVTPKQRASIEAGNGPDAIVSILLQLALARGSLPAVLQLADFLSSHPQLLSPEALTELDKLSDVESFEPAARQLFKAPAGSLEHFAAEWAEHVLPAVRKAGKAEDEAAIIAKVQEGDGEGAEELIRNLLPEKTFAALRVPNLRRLRESTDAVRFTAAVQRLTERKDSPPGSAVGVLARIFAHVQVVSLRLDDATRERAPLSIDVGVVEPLVALLSTHCSADKLTDDDAEAAARRDLCIALLELLSVNVARMVAARVPLPESSGAALQQTLTAILGLDLSKHPECSQLGEPAADLFSAAQQFLLRSAEAKMSFLSELTSKLIAPPPSSAALSLEPEQVGDGTLAPISVEIPERMKGCIEASCGLIKVPDVAAAKEGVQFKSPSGMSAGEKYYLEVRLADSSTATPSEQNAQGFEVLIGLCAASCDINCDKPGPEDRIHQFHPVKGLTVSMDAEGEPQEGSVDGFGEWWKSSKSVCAGDSAGLFLDTSSGELIALKNRKPIGAIFTDLPEGDWSWMLLCGPFTGL
eukprot:COSAG04_NODE_4777_length_1898_cov_3.818232_1_plen_571_part_10